MAPDTVYTFQKDKLSVAAPDRVQWDADGWLSHTVPVDFAGRLMSARLRDADTRSWCRVQLHLNTSTSAPCKATRSPSSCSWQFFCSRSSRLDWWRNNRQVVLSRIPKRRRNAQDQCIQRRQVARALSKAQTASTFCLMRHKQMYL